MPKANLKPLSRALVTRGLSRRVVTTLSRDLEETIFRHAEVLSEGYTRRGADVPVYFGSTMITVDLGVIARGWRGPFDEQARAALLSAVDGSVRIRLRAMRLGCAEVARRVQSRLLGTAQVETRVRVSGDQLHIDVDLEVPLGLSSSSERK